MKNNEIQGTEVALARDFGLPSAVARIWRMRDRVELEAAHLFQNLGDAISSVRGDEDEVALLCQKAAADERRHSVLCREILSEASEFLVPLTPRLEGSLGPKDLNVSDQALYGAVAMGCVTETLSTALLIEMRDRAKGGRIRDTIHEILTDEITHSRIGWAELSRSYTERRVDWLGVYVPGMIREALALDVEPMLPVIPQPDLSPWGVLPRSEALKIMEMTVASVVLPGLAQWGVRPAARTSF